MKRLMQRETGFQNIAIVLCIALLFNLVVMPFAGNDVTAAEETIFYETDFNNGATGQVPSGWTAPGAGTSAAPITVTANEIAEVSSGTDKSWHFSKSGAEASVRISSAMNPQASGNFYYETKMKIDALSTDGVAEILGASSDWKTQLHIRMLSAGNDKFSITLNPGAAGVKNVDGTFDLGSWYTIQVRYREADKQYDLVIFDSTGTPISVTKDIAIKTPAGTSTIGYCQLKLNRTVDCYINYIKVYKPAAEEPLPDITPSSEPSAAVSPETSVSPDTGGELLFDNEDWDVFEVVFDSNPGNAENGSSNTGGSSYGTLKNHAYCDIPGSYALYTLKGADSGMYDLYFNFPLIHTSNTSQMYIEVTDSTGKQVYYQVFDTKAVQNNSDPKQNVNADGSLKTGTLLKLGNFQFNSMEPGTVKVGAVDNKRYRADAVILRKTSDVLSKPIAADVKINGLLKNGQELTGSYEFIQENGFHEKDSVLKWYRGDSADAQQWTEIGSGENYTLTEADVDKYIKFSITPKCDAENAEIQTGEEVSAVIGPVPDDDLPGTASNIKISGTLENYRTIEATYEYSDPNLDPEGESVYQWYSCDTKDGTYQPISGASGTCTAAFPVSFTLTENEVGKYIKTGITVKSSDKTAAEVFSEAAGPVEKMDVKAPIARNAALSGTLTTAHPVNAFYVYEQAAGLPEGDSEIQWYISDTADGTFTPISGANGKTYRPTEDQEYKYIKFSVTPAAAGANIKGKTVESKPGQVKWNLSWYDEFDYTAKDGWDETFQEKWIPDNYNHTHIASARFPENIEVKDGSLFLKQKYGKEIAPGKDWTSGSCSTAQLLGYGHYEARYKYAPAEGLNQSFWAYTDGGITVLDGYEIDMNEGHFPKGVNGGGHYMAPKDNLPEGADPTLPENRERKRMPLTGYLPDYVDNLAEDFHIYEMDWNEDEIVFYLDGQEYSRFDNTMARAEKMKARIYFSTAVLAWAGQIGPEIDGTAMEVDYFRYYQLEEDFVDKDGLQNAVDRAEQALNSAVAGNDIFLYPNSAIQALQEKTADIKENVLENVSAAQEDVSAALTELNASIDSFFEKMISSGVLSAQKNIVTVPALFGKDVILTNITPNIDAKLRVPENTPLAADITIKTKITAGSEQVMCDILFPAGTIFRGDAADGYTEINLPKSLDSFDASTVPGKIDGGFDMGLTQINTPVRISIPYAGESKLGYFDQDGAFRQMESTLTDDKYITAGNQVPANGMLQLDPSKAGGQTIIWSKTISPVIFYTPAEPVPSEKPVIGGGGNGAYFPSAEPSTKPSAEPSPVPSEEPTGEPSGSPSDFKDISGHWAEKEIIELAKQGIVKGKTEELFMPEETVTRAEFAAMIRRALELEPKAYQNKIPDILKDTWYADEIQAMIDAGIMSGDADGKFRPDDTMTRQEMAKVIVSAYSFKTGITDITGEELAFDDNSQIAAWAEEFVSKAAALGLITGMENNTFAPNNNMTRAQAAMVIFRLVNCE